MNWRPNSGPETARARAALLQRTRRYFENRQVLEVTTPALVSHSVTDPAIAALPVATDAGTARLHTSPEYCMKRLLAAGYPDIYQVCPVYRGGERGRHHLAEFTMLEWYRLGFQLDDIIDDAVCLSGLLLDDLRLAEPLIIDYAEAVEAALSLNALTATAATLAEALAADDSLREAVGDDRDAWLDLAMATRVATGFADNRLTVIRHYPASQASLARLCPADPRVADRFEIYLGAVELANGFVELTDPDEQLRRFAADRAKRKADGKPDVAIDMALIDALRAGLPDCAGVALGLDRALMIAEGRDIVAEVTTFTPGPDR